MGYRIELAPKRIAEARHLYERTDTPVREIAAKLGMSRWSLYCRIYRWGWPLRQCRKVAGHAPALAARAAPRTAEPVPAAPRADRRRRRALPFADRVWRLRDVGLATLVPRPKAPGRRAARRPRAAPAKNNRKKS